MRKSVWMGLAAVAAVAGSAPAPAAAQAAKDLLECAAIPRDADRLACYDAAVAQASPAARAASETRAREARRIAAEEATAAAAAAKAKAAADAVAAAAAAREDFGAEGVPSRSAERFRPAPGEVVEIEAGITEVLTNRSGLGVFMLDNGQVWRQVDTTNLPNIRDGDRVKVAKGTLGGYDLVFVKSKRRAKVKRLR